MSYSDLIELIAHVTVDDSEVTSLKSKVDATVADWRAKRSEMISQMHEVNQGIGLLVRGIRLVVEATGSALDPMQNAMLGLVSSTSSLIISTAVALTAGSLGILTGVGLAMAAFAYGMQISQTIAIMANFAELRRSNGEILGRLDVVESAQRMRGFMIGGL